MKKLLDPKQELFLSLYTNPKSETFANAYKSAKKAGYSEEYSQNITGQLPEWLSESISDMKRLRKAEKNLDEIQNLPIIDEQGKVDVQLIDKRIKVDIFLAKSLDKNKYSDRKELTGANGEKLQITFDDAFKKE